MTALMSLLRHNPARCEFLWGGAIRLLVWLLVSLRLGAAFWTKPGRALTMLISWRNGRHLKTSHRLHGSTRGSQCDTRWACRSLQETLRGWMNFAYCSALRVMKCSVIRNAIAARATESDYAACTRPFNGTSGALRSIRQHRYGFGL